MTNENTRSRRVTVLGLGAMGSRMAHRLVEAGWTVTVWNRSPGAVEPLEAAGAVAAATPREAAQAGDFVLSMVTDDAAAREVWLGPGGAVEGLSENTIAIETSTVTPEWIQELAQAIEGSPATLIESPVLGSRPQADAGQLIALTGGDRDAVHRAGAVLKAFAGHTIYLGEIGQGAAAKLAINFFFASQVAAASEALHFLQHAGLELERILDLFSNVPVVAPPIVGATQAMAQANFSPMFPIELVEKDLRYFIDTAERNRAARPVSEAIQTLFAQAVDRGFGDDNITGISQILANEAALV